MVMTTLPPEDQHCSVAATMLRHRVERPSPRCDDPLTSCSSVAILDHEKASIDHCDPVVPNIDRNWTTHHDYQQLVSYTLTLHRQCNMSRPCRTQNPAKPQKPHPVSLRPCLRQSSAERQCRVSLTETYTVATTCKRKLGFEADRADRQLRRLVCHANMLDALMEELADRERGLEGKLNALIRAAPRPHSGQQIQWLDRIAEESEEEESDFDSDSGFHDSSDEEDAQDGTSCRVIIAKKSPPPKLLAGYFAKSGEDLEEDDEAHDYELVLKRWPSHQLVPELTKDGDSDSEEEQSAECFRGLFKEHCSVTTADTPQLQ